MQLSEFTACVLLARGACGVFVVAFSTPLKRIAGLLDTLFDGRPTALLYFVMICCPMAMNLAQAWVQDHVLAQDSAASQAQYDTDLQLREWLPDSEAQRARSSVQTPGQGGHAVEREDDVELMRSSDFGSASAAGSLSASSSMVKRGSHASSSSLSVP